MQLDHVQVSHMNKAEEFWKDVQTTFFRERNLFFMQDRGHVNQVIKSERIKKLQESNVGCCLLVN